MKVIITSLCMTFTLVTAFQAHSMMRLFSAMRERCTLPTLRYTTLSSLRHQTHTYRFNAPIMNTQPSIFAHLTSSPLKTFSMLLAESWPCRKTNKTATYQYVKPVKPHDNFTTALRDFESLNPAMVRPMSKSAGKVGVLPCGATVSVRTTSSSGEPTLEVRNPVTGETKKIRYPSSENKQKQPKERIL